MHSSLQKEKQTRLHTITFALKTKNALQLLKQLDNPYKTKTCTPAKQDDADEENEDDEGEDFDDETEDDRCLKDIWSKLGGARVLREGNPASNDSDADRRQLRRRRRRHLFLSNLPHTSKSDWKHPLRADDTAIAANGLIFAIAERLHRQRGGTYFPQYSGNWSTAT